MWMMLTWATDIQEEAHPGVRKPIEGDCPICVFEFEEGDDLL